jgi:hypothetical protein
MHLYVKGSATFPEEHLRAVTQDLVKLLAKVPGVQLRTHD